MCAEAEHPKRFYPPLTVLLLSQRSASNPVFYKGFAEVGAGGKRLWKLEGVSGSRGGWREARPGLSVVRSEQSGSSAQLSASWKIPPSRLLRPALPQPAPGPLALCPSSASSGLLKGLDQWHKSPAGIPTLGLLTPKAWPLAALGVGLS